MHSFLKLLLQQEHTKERNKPLEIGIFFSRFKTMQEKGVINNPKLFKLGNFFFNIIIISYIQRGNYKKEQNTHVW